MTIELSYRYSELDREHGFGIVSKNDAGWETYMRWVWYYIGTMFKKGCGNRIYPYHYESKILKEYKNCNDAKRQAELLVNKMKKTLQKHKK